ncbi:hypothetical protein J3R83DRAFT_10734 [Lanmaoa asiatica]|nr:hypothetical protein J3R83DRAFT_10734 [Lanmaoa asiatica]
MVSMSTLPRFRRKGRHYMTYRDGEPLRIFKHRGPSSDIQMVQVQPQTPPQGEVTK